MVVAGDPPLTEIEQRLLDAVAAGELLDLAGDGPVDEAALRALDETRAVRAAVIRDLVRGRCGIDADPHGLRLRGARIVGRIDLENIVSDVPIELYNCWLPDGLVVRDSRLPALLLEESFIGQPADSSDSPVDATRLNAVVVMLDKSTIRADSGIGAVVLSDAHLGLLSCDGTQIHNGSGPALIADGVRVDQYLFLRDEFEAIGAGKQAAVRLLGAHIGQVECDGARLRNDTGPALDADGVRVDQYLLLREGFEATGTSEQSAVRLTGAYIGGTLELDGAHLRNDLGPALDAYSIRVEHGMSLSNGFRASGVSDAGAVVLISAHVGRSLNLEGADLRNSKGPAIAADGLQVTQAMFLREGFQATGAGEDGAVRLVGAYVGRLECDGARLHNDSGPALTADGLRVDQYLFLRGGFEAIGASNLGAVVLAGASIGAGLNLDGARLRNDEGPALDAENVRVDQDLLLGYGFEATGASELAAVRLDGARIGGRLRVEEARLRNEKGAALSAERLQVNNEFVVTDSCQATGGGQVVISLGNTQVGGALWLKTSQVTRAVPDGGALVYLDGLTYVGIPEPAAPVDGWLTLLRRHTPAYAAQPYQQLAAVYRAAGHDSEARDVLIAQRRDQIKRGNLRRRDRAWARFTGLTLGYGYQPWRALMFLFATVALAVTAAVVAGQHGGLARTSSSVTPAAACNLVEQVGAGLDLGLPLIKTSTGDSCAPTASTAGQALTIAGWILQLAAWAFATLFVAGFTTAVRRT